MPNWLHLFVNLVYHLGLAIWIGGTIALGALTAPALFRTLPRPQAGGIFGPILRRFARLRVVALALSIAAAATKHLIWESGATLWIAIRWAALFVMAATLVYEIAHLERAIGAAEPQSERFKKLHTRAERLMKLSFLAAIVALLLS